VKALNRQDDLRNAEQATCLLRAATHKQGILRAMAKGCLDLLLEGIADIEYHMSRVVGIRKAWIRVVLECRCDRIQEQV
jgi:hypothetical protein